MSFLSSSEGFSTIPLPGKAAGKKTDPYHRAFAIITAELMAQAGKILREKIETSAEEVAARCRGIDQSIRWKMTHGGSSNVHHLRAVESPAEHGTQLQRAAVKQAVSNLLEDIDDPESGVSQKLSNLPGYLQVRKTVLERMEWLAKNPETLMTHRFLSQVRPDTSGMTMNLGNVHARSIDRFMTNR